MPLNRLIENSRGYAGFADNCHTPVNEKPLQTPRGLQGLFSILKRIRKFYIGKYSLFLSSWQIISGKPVGNANPDGLVSSTESKGLLRLDSGCRLSRQCLSVPIDVVD